MENIKKFRVYIVIAIIIVGVIYVWQNQTLTSRSGDEFTKSMRVYNNDALGLSFDYPGEFNVLEQMSDESTSTPVAIALSSGKDQIVFTPKLITIADVQKEKKANDQNLFKDSAGQLRNSKVTIGKFEGYKTLIDFDKSSYLLYLPISENRSLRFKIGMSAESADRLLTLEGVLQSILSDVKVN